MPYDVVWNGVSGRVVVTPPRNRWRYYLANIRSQFASPTILRCGRPEWGGRIRPRHIEERFAEYRDALQLPAELVPIACGTPT